MDEGSVKVYHARQTFEGKKKFNFNGNFLPLFLLIPERKAETSSCDFFNRVAT
jgi:hypothetical protein